MLAHSGGKVCYHSENRGSILRDPRIPSTARNVGTLGACVNGLFRIPLAFQQLRGLA